MLPGNKWVRMPLYIDKDETDKDEFIRLNAIEKNILSFVESGKNLYLYSTNCGNGKTSWAIRLIQSYFDSVWPKADMGERPCKALFISMPNFFIQLKNSISKQNDYINFIKENILDCDLVVWDDIGTKAGTEFEMENFLSILDSRLSSGKSNIYTSNIPPNDLMEFIGARLYSRVVNQSSELIFLRGKDKRGITNDSTTTIK